MSGNCFPCFCSPKPLIRRSPAGPGVENISSCGAVVYHLRSPCDRFSGAPAKVEPTTPVVASPAKRGYGGFLLRVQRSLDRLESQLFCAAYP